MEIMKSTEGKMLLIFLVVFFILVSLSRANIGIVAVDEFSHAQGGLVYKGLGESLIKNPFSLSGLRDVILEDHLHYKSFSGFALYPPFHIFFMGILLFLFGVSGYIIILPAIIEAVLLLYFTYRLSCLFSKDRRVSLLTVVLLGFNAFFFFYSGSAYLEIGSALFMVVSAYYFSLYLMKNKSKHLYFTAIAVALGILTKPPMVLMFPVLLLTLLWTRKLSILKRNFRKVILALLICFLVVSPWLAEEAYFKSQGVSPTALDKWLVHHLGRTYCEAGGAEGFVFASSNPIRYYNCMSFQQNIVFYASVISYQWYLVPFIILGLLYAVKPNIVQKNAIIIILVFLIGFSFSDAHTRYIVAVLPFILMFAASGLLRVFKRLSYPVIIVVIFLALAQCSLVLATVAQEGPLYDYDSASRFIIEDADGETSVVTSEAAAQGLSLSMLDQEREIYVIYTPAKGVEMEQMLNGTYEHEGKWEMYELEHPAVGYVLLYEKHETRDNYDYNVFDLMGQRKDFELIRTIDGLNMNSRIFIYKGVQ